MTFGSLFSGIGGIDLGLERAGMQCAWQVEIDPYCRKVLAKHWPKVERFEDVRNVGAHNLKPVDLIAGGFPCTDISHAGKRAGISGEQSGLWSEFNRIIGELRPRLVLIENVAALLVRGMERVLADLASRRYDVEWDCLPAAAFGAPHRRDRVFLVAHACGSVLREQQECGPQIETPAQSGVDGSPGSVADTEGQRWRTWRTGRPTRSDWWSVEPELDRVAYGVPDRVDRLRGLGNAVVPQVAEWIGRRLAQRTEKWEGP